MKFIRAVLDKLSVIFFVFSLLVIGFGYGYISHRENIFPQSLIQEASVAAKALLALHGGEEAEEEGSDKPVDPARAGGPNTYDLADTHASGPDDLLLIAGGLHQNVERCPVHGCLAWLIDREGEIVHSWAVDFGALWDGSDPRGGLTWQESSLKVFNLELARDGSLIVSFQVWPEHPYGAGLAKIDVDGNLLWVKRDYSHHWFTMDDEGLIYSPNQESIKSPIPLDPTDLKLVCKNLEMLVDFIRVVDATDGATVRDIPLFEIMLENGYAGLIDHTSDPCDPLHLNFVQYVGPDIAAQFDGVESGDLLISMRNINTIALLDPQARKIKWISSGANSLQHSPRFLPDGSIIVFDNWGGDRAFGGSRLTRQRFDEVGAETLFPLGPLPDGRTFRSRFGGFIDLDASGRRALVSLTQTGDLYEIDLESGKLLWHYEKIFPAENYPIEEADAPDRLRRAEIWSAYYVDPEMVPKSLTARLQD